MLIASKGRIASTILNASMRRDRGMGIWGASKKNSNGMEWCTSTSSTDRIMI